MSMEDLLKNGKSTTFFATMAVLVLGGLYLFFGPNADEPAATAKVADFMKSVVMMYIGKEAATKGIAAGADVVKGRKADV